MDVLLALLSCLIFLTLWSWYKITSWFFAITRVKNMGYPSSKLSDVPELAKQIHADMGWQVSFTLIPSLILGAVADVVYNILWGTWFFKALPRELFFTNRLKTMQARGNSEQRQIASEWIDKRVNRIQPGHI